MTGRNRQMTMWVTLRILLPMWLVSAPAALAAEKCGDQPEAADPAAALTNPADRAHEVSLVLGLHDCAIVTLERSLVPEGGGTVRVALGGETYTLALEPHSVRAADYRVLVQLADGSYVAAPPEPIRTVRGRVMELEGSAVAASLTDAGLRGLVRLPGQPRWWIEPLADRLPGFAAGEHVVYQDGDVECGHGTCGLTADELEPGTTNGATVQQAAMGGENWCVAELACDADYEYFAAHRSNVAEVQNRINEVINAMNDEYERGAGITHQITTIVVRTSTADPYSSSDPNALLAQFALEWSQNQANIVRDVAQLFTGRNLDGNTIGLAYRATICNFALGYSVVQSDWSDLLPCVTDLSAHELGHNWGAFHCDCLGFTMHDPIQCANVFHPVSIAEILAHRATRTCLHNTWPPPANLSASDGAACYYIRVDWMEVMGATGYEVWRSSANVLASAIQIASTDPSVTYYDDYAAQEGFTYYYWIRATSDGCPTPFGASDDGYRGVSIALVGVAASDGEFCGYVRVTWNAVPGGLSYDVWRGTSTDPAAAAPIALAAYSPFEDVTAVPGATYYYWVRVTNGCGTSAFGAYDSGFIPPGTPAPPPSDVAASEGLCARIRVSWTAPGDAVSFEIWRGTDGWNYALIGTAAASPFDDQAAVGTDPFLYKVKAVYPWCVSGFSLPDSGFQETPPEAPSGADATNSGYCFVEVTWSSVLNAAEYQIWRSLDNDPGSAVLVGTTDVVPFRDFSGDVGVWYWYWVAAANACGTSALSDPPDRGRRSCAFPLGDLDCNGAVDFDDINPFVLALSDPAGYQAAYPDCWLGNGDCNGDGDVDFDDINAFVALLAVR